MCSNLRDGVSSEGPHLFCDKGEVEGNSSSWPVDIVKVDLPASPGIGLCTWIVFSVYYCCLNIYDNSCSFPW